MYNVNYQLHLAISYVQDIKSNNIRILLLGGLRLFSLKCSDPHL